MACTGRPAQGTQAQQPQNGMTVGGAPQVGGQPQVTAPNSAGFNAPLQAVSQQPRTQPMPKVPQSSTPSMPNYFANLPTQAQNQGIATQSQQTPATNYFQNNTNKGAPLTSPNYLSNVLPALSKMLNSQYFPSIAGKKGSIS